MFIFLLQGFTKALCFCKKMYYVCSGLPLISLAIEMASILLWRVKIISIQIQINPFVFQRNTDYSNLKVQRNDLTDC